MMLAALLLLLQASPSIPNALASPEQDAETIVVVGRAPQRTGAALADCLAQGCAPSRDIALSLAHAQSQFVAGDYLASRRTLSQAIRRNRRHASELPEDVSRLHRASSKIAGLNGLVREERITVFDVVSALKAGLDSQDRRVLLARIEVGFAFAKDGRTRAALDEYAVVVRLARKIGDRAVEGEALFQRAVLLTVLASMNSNGIPAARRAAAQFAESDEPSWQPYRDAIRIVPAMLASHQKRASLLDQAVSGMEPRPVERLLLLYAAPVDLGAAASLAGEKTEWLDLRFAISADGKVRDVKVLRGSGRVKDAWVQAAAQALRKRRYTPLLMPEGQTELQRTERISFVSDYLIEWNSKSFGRSSDRRVVSQGLEGKALGER